MHNELNTAIGAPINNNVEAAQILFTTAHAWGLPARDQDARAVARKKTKGKPLGLPFVFERPERPASFKAPA
jgi:hypothetical protein